VGGPGNSLFRNYCHSVEKDVSFIVERTANAKVGLVVLFRGYDNPWMNRRVRRGNLLLDQALMGCDMADDCTTHGVHLNSQGKRRLMHLIAERIGDGQV
jgi:hypothetical protein